MRAGKPASAEWIACCSTVYVGDPAAELPIEHGVRCDLPQFSGSGLDRTFFERLHAILSGKTEFELALAREDPGGNRLGDAPLRRLNAAVPIPYERSVVVFACAAALCASIATLDAQRAQDIARRWRTLLWPAVFPEGSCSPNGRFSESVLLEIAGLARSALADGKSLLVRVEYRRRRSDPATGAVLEASETRH